MISEQLFLEIPPPAALEPPCSTAGGRQRVRINQDCLNAFLPWLREEIDPIANVTLNGAVLASFWEFVNGTALSCHQSRLILVPTLAIDLEEIRVPQEWVDIPEWVGDYYVAVQVNLDQGWIQIFGYTTHQRLKTIGVYQASDRTYSLEAGELRDCNVLWTTQQQCLQETLRVAIPPLPTLPKPQAESLLERLGNPAIVFPRLAVPFPIWGALMAHGGWRKRLYEQRQGLSGQWLIQQWLQTGLPHLVQQLGWQQQQWIPGSALRGTEPQAPITGLLRQLTIAENHYDLRVFAIGDPADRIWRFEVRSAAPDKLIPIGFKLRLLTEDLQPFENNEDTATTPMHRLYVEVMLEPGEGLVWEIEPTPAGFDREILRF